MDYKIVINEFEGPLDLLLHLIKKSDIDIYDISIEKVTKQYFDFINEMESLNLTIASEYLVMAAELIELKSKLLLPNHSDEDEEGIYEDPREMLINRLLEYKKYKEVITDFKDLEESRRGFFTKEPSNLKQYVSEDKTILLDSEITLDDLTEAFQKFLDRKRLEKPLNTKIAKREMTVTERTRQIRQIIKSRKQIKFVELFEIATKDYVVITFLSMLEMAKKSEIKILQNENFEEIMILNNEVK